MSHTKRSLSRRHFLGTAAAAAVVRLGIDLECPWAQVPRPAPNTGVQPDQTLVLTNGASTRWTPTTPSCRPLPFGTDGSSASARRSFRDEHESDRSQWTHGCAGARRAARAYREPRQPAGLSHDSGEHGVDPRSAGGARGAAERRARRSVDHVDGRLASEPVERTPSSRRGRNSTRQCPIGPCSCTSASPDRR